MSEESGKSNNQKTIYLAIILFGGFTLLVIFYLIYRYFNIRRRDIEQTNQIRQHNEQYLRRIANLRKKKLEQENKRILTDSIINFNSNFDSSIVNFQICAFCNKDMNKLNLELDTKDDLSSAGILIFLFYVLLEEYSVYSVTSTTFLFPVFYGYCIDYLTQNFVHFETNSTMHFKPSKMKEKGIKIER